MTRPLVVGVALDEVGTKEIPGFEDNPKIVAYHRTTLLKASDDETPWCSSFVNWCFAQVGITGTRSAAAKSWLKWGKKIDHPVPGAVAIWDRGVWKGHVGIVSVVDDDGFFSVEGNKSNAVREVYHKTGEVDLMEFRVPDL